MLQQRESAQRRSQIMATLKSHHNYVFTPLSVEERLLQIVGQPLASWIIASAAATFEEVKACRILRKRYLVPYVMTPSQYNKAFGPRSWCTSSPPIRGISVLLDVGELASEEDNAFIRWVYKTRRLSRINAIRASADKADVRLERNTPL